MNNDPSHARRIEPIYKRCLEISSKTPQLSAQSLALSGFTEINLMKNGIVISNKVRLVAQWYNQYKVEIMMKHLLLLQD